MNKARNSLGPVQTDVHVIRLHGPWALKINDADTGTRLPFPCSVSVSQLVESPRVSVARAFNRPTGLLETSCVKLLLQLETPEAIVILNRKRLGPGLYSEPSSWDVTKLLQPHNLLEVEYPQLSVSYIVSDLKEVKLLNEVSLLIYD